MGVGSCLVGAIANGVGFLRVGEGVLDVAGLLPAGLVHYFNIITPFTQKCIPLGAAGGSGPPPPFENFSDFLGAGFAVTRTFSFSADALVSPTGLSPVLEYELNSAACS